MGWVDAGQAWNWGVGVLTLDGSTRSSAVSMTPPSGGGLDQTVKIFLAESRQDIYSALNVTAQTQASYGLASASATVELAESVTESGYDLYLVMAATAYFPAATANASLTAAAQALLQNGQYADFVRQYGDQFIFGMQTGGIYAGILEIHAQSSDVRQAIKAGLGITGSGTLLSAQVEATVSTTLNTYSQLVQTTVDQKALGGSPVAQSVTVQDMMSTALSFPSTVTTANAWPMYADIRPYTELNVPNAPALADYLSAFEGPSATLTQRQADVVTLQDRLASASFANDHPEAFAAPATSVRALVQNELSTLPALISAIGQGTGAYAKSLTAAVNRNQSPSSVPAPPSYTMPDPVALPEPQGGVAYVIQSKTGYVLAPGTVQPPNQSQYPGVVLASWSNADVSQRWLVTGTLPLSGDANVQIVNGATKQSLGYVIDVFFPQWPASQIVCESGDAATGWNVKGDPANGYAVRPQPNEHANMNALVGPSHQAKPGTYVGLWEWGGGQDNEMWLFRPVLAALLAEAERDSGESEPTLVPAATA